MSGPTFTADYAMNPTSPASNVRVGIVTWNTAALLDRCLRALPAALGDLDAEIVVVDNASADDVAAVASAHPEVTFIRNTANVGYARGMNQALAGTTAPVLIALNPDTEPPPGSLARLVEVLREHPHAALVAPRLVNPDGSLQHSVYRFPSAAVSAAASLPSFAQRGAVGERYWLLGHAAHDRSTEIDWAIGAVHCIRAAAVDPGSVYRERWFMYVEDLDLCWRLHSAGWRVVFERDVEVPHVGNAAGAQAWGAQRTQRWLDPTYDWYVMTHGRLAARWYAAVNVFALLSRLVPVEMAALFSTRRRDSRRADAREVRQWLRWHGRKLVFGPLSPLVPSPVVAAAVST